MKIPRSNSSDSSSNTQQVNYDNSEETGNGSANGANTENITQTQTHEEAMFRAVDRFCNAPEQTYEEFLSSFTYFRPDPAEQLHNQLAFDMTSASSASSQQQVSQNPGTALVSQVSSSGHESNSEEEDQLEEEILTGSLLPEMADSCESKARPMIKVDNFVDDEDTLTDSEDDQIKVDYEPYVASFASDKRDNMKSDAQRAVHPGESTTAVSRDNDDVDVEGQADEESVQIPFIQPSSLSTDVRSGPAAQLTDIKYDSRDRAVREVDQEVCDVLCQETDSFSQQAKDFHYPGEITEAHGTASHRSLEQVTHIRQMEYSAKLAECEPDLDTSDRSTQENQQNDSTASDEVQAFRLDEDFDYDNVILTPKYSKSELNELKMALDNTTV